MNKSAIKVPTLDLSRFCKSSFTLTFVVEVIGIEIWHDCNEGWLELGPAVHGMKLQYHLYPGQTYEVDILIWPHTAKVFCGTNHGWVRTWQFLERRWLTFSIRHAFPVRVADLQHVTATVVPHAGMGTLSANAKSVEKNIEVLLPSLAFGQRRQFATVKESEEVDLKKFITDLIWNCVVNYIPMMYLDGVFDTPYPVSEIRHQDAALFYVRETVLNQLTEKQPEVDESPKMRRESKTKDKALKKTPEMNKYEIKLSGHSILAGVGRITPFKILGDRPPDLGEVIALISSNNLPAQDDLPVVFVNIGTLINIPVENFIKHRITHIYTKWTISDEEHSSEHQVIKQSLTELNFDDHHSLPMHVTLASDIMATFIDNPFQIELRGIRVPLPLSDTPNFFGYDKRDRDFGVAVPPPLPNQDPDILIALTRIDARLLSKVNGFIREDFPLYPPKTSVVKLEREGICTNDINAVRAKVQPELVIQPGVILEAQMMLEVSMGLVGCKPHKAPQRFSRLYCLISDAEAIMLILRQITEINESLLLSGNTQGLLTGFGLDTGNTVLLYVEGPKDGNILQVWDMTEDFYPKIKPVFSTSAKYRNRLYPELLLAAMPFNILKMFVPLAVVLAITPIYARPALPLPTRSALLKIGSIVASKLRSAPCSQDMPTAMELKSFRLELCVAPRPPPVTISESTSAKLLTSSEQQPRPSMQSAARINWESKTT